ncbi:MAG: hypothetical protein KKA19_08775 [Candidatus Margulisbacteria bacterium]|nr:hypothetical protein [Candidatus Margulisiibacteriota bacterium]
MDSIKLIEPIFAPKTWGNNQAIIDFLGKDPGFKETVGEIFLASGLTDELGGSTKIGKKTIRELFTDKTTKVALFGNVFLNTEDFPFLWKFLAVNQPLSLQVHPHDLMLGNKRIPGKTEGWWAASDAKVLVGFKPGFSKSDFEHLLNNKFFEHKHSVEELTEYLNLVELKKGETIYVESGTVHAILSGNLLEPQQPSNITYRIYDWGRNDPKRPLHLKKALAVINYNSRPQKTSGKGVFLDKPNFKIEHLTIKGTIKKDLEKEKFHLILPVKNSIQVTVNSSQITIPGGQCALVTANTPSIDINADQTTDIFIANAKT